MILPTQHCTSKRCPYTMSHTAAWCGSKQKRKCPCSWDRAARHAAKGAR